MVALETKVREQFGKLGLPPELVDARLGELSADRLERLKKLKSLDAQTELQGNRFAGGLQDNRLRVAKAFSNPSPAVAQEGISAFVAGNYAQDGTAAHPSAQKPLKFLLNARKSAASIKSMALSQRPELSTRVATAVGAQVVSDGRTDGVVSIQRPASPSPGSGQYVPPPPSSRLNTIGDILTAMDEAILLRAAELGLGQGSGLGGTPAFLEAMGLWSLKPDDGDAADWLGFGGYDESSGGSPSTSSNNTAPSPGNQHPGSAEAEVIAESGAGNSGLDVEIMRLKRDIDKKTQLMEAFSQSVTKYHQSAQNIITNLKG